MTESQQPNPFSRQGSSPSDGLSSDASPDTDTPTDQPAGSASADRNTQEWQSYPSADPYGGPAADPYGGPSADPYGRPSADPYGAPTVDPYGRPITSYGSSMYNGPGLDSQPMPSYGDPERGYLDSPYRNPYEANPYQPTFGGVAPYGSVSTTPAVPHPQAALALILGVLGTVLGFGCIIGGLVGIGGIVVGRRVKKDIDADPGRYTGRSQAIAGIITGIVGVSICVLATLFIVLAIIAGISNANF
jgi:hypothetical protein